MSVKKHFSVPFLFLLVLTAAKPALALDELYANQFAVSAGYFMPKEKTMQGGWSFGLRYIPLETGKAQLSFGAIFSAPSVKAAKQSFQHRDYFVNYTMKFGTLASKRKVTPFLGASLDYVDIPENGISPHESAGFSVNGGFHFSHHVTLEGRFLVSRKNNLNRGGLGVSLLYRF